MFGNPVRRLRDRFRFVNRQPRGKLSRQVGRGRLGFQALEDRLNLSTVTSLADAGPGSLREAIVSTLQGGTIDFQSGLSGTIKLTSGDLVVDHNLTIAGSGAGSITISGGNASRVFDITAGTNVSLSGLTIANGSSVGNSGTNGFGGGIYNAGTLALHNCAVSGNFATFGGGGIDNVGTLTVTGSTLSGNATTAGLGSGGGAIENEGQSVTVTSSVFSANVSEQGGGIINNSGTLSVDGSTFSQNHGGAGGGIFSVFAKATTTVTNSTFSGNYADTSAGYVGGGIANNLGYLAVSGCTFSENSAGTATINGDGGGVYNQDGMILVSNSTFYSNHAYRGGAIDSRFSVGTPIATIDNSTIDGNSAGIGGGVNNGSGTLNLHDTLVAGNTAPSAADVYGAVTSQGHNVIGSGAGGSGYLASDLVGGSTPIDPKLGPLQNNGGPTQTMALLPGSPAIDVGDNSGAPTYDQRGTGYPRVANGTIDIGAFELQSTTESPKVITNPQPQTAIVGTTVAFTAAATGNPTPAVQWQVSTDGGKGFADLAGATATTLSFLVTAAENGYEYRAEFSNSAGKATTNAAILTVQAISIHGPGNRKVESGDRVSFYATSSDPSATVIWQVSTDGGKTFHNIPGADHGLLSFRATRHQSGYEFRAAFHTAHGIAVTHAARLTVISDG